jgi:hypothetical protein
MLTACPSRLLAHYDTTEMCCGVLMVSYVCTCAYDTIVCSASHDGLGAAAALQQSRGLALCHVLRALGTHGCTHAMLCLFLARHLASHLFVFSRQIASGTPKCLKTAKYKCSSVLADGSSLRLVQGWLHAVWRGMPRVGISSVVGVTGLFAMAQCCRVSAVKLHTQNLLVNKPLPFLARAIRGLLVPRSPILGKDSS